MESPTPLLLLLLLSLANAFYLSSAFVPEVLVSIINLIPQVPPLSGQQPTLPLLPIAPIPPPVLVSPTGGKGRYRHMAREFVRAHNSLRVRFGERPVKWSKKLAMFAQWWSDQLRDTCCISHSSSEYGENQFWGSGWNWKAFDAVASWAAEIDLYDAESNTCLPETNCGHFTQIVWNTTRRIGCGRAECYRGGVIITCSYHPPGNFGGERPFPLNHGGERPFPLNHSKID